MVICIILLGIVCLLLILKVIVMRRSADEILEQLDMILQNDTNAVIGISIRIISVDSSRTKNFLLSSFLIMIPPNKNSRKCQSFLTLLV